MIEVSGYSDRNNKKEQKEKLKTMKIFLLFKITGGATSYVSLFSPNPSKSVTLWGLLTHMITENEARDTHINTYSTHAISLESFHPFFTLLLIHQQATYSALTKAHARYEVRIQKIVDILRRTYSIKKKKTKN